MSLKQDHFALVLNEPAGRVAQVVVQYSVKLIVEVRPQYRHDLVFIDREN